MVLDRQATEPLRQFVGNPQVINQPLPHGQSQVGAAQRLWNHPVP